VDACDPVIPLALRGRAVVPREISQADERGRVGRDPRESTARNGDPTTFAIFSWIKLGERDDLDDSGHAWGVQVRGGAASQANTRVFAFWPAGAGARAR
jgi:hypothetical protein